MRRPENECILVVDDDITALTMYETLLMKAGYGRVIICDDGRDAATG